VRAVLAPIAALAERYGVAVLIVAHRRKSSGDFADDLALGSRGFTGIARAVWHLGRDPENKRRRLLLPGKSNLAPEGGGLAFTIEGRPPLLLWETQPVDMTADDLLAAENRRQRQSQRRGPEPEALTEATDWLKKALADGPRLAAELLDEWKNGEGGSGSTLNRARRALGVKAFRPEVPGPWHWRLPEQEPKIVGLAA
jgi:hypothetical protein